MPVMVGSLTDRHKTQTVSFLWTLQWFFHVLGSGREKTLQQTEAPGGGPSSWQDVAPDMASTFLACLCFLPTQPGSLLSPMCSPPPSSAAQSPPHSRFPGSLPLSSPLWRQPVPEIHSCTLSQLLAATTAFSCITRTLWQHLMGLEGKNNSRVQRRKGGIAERSRSYRKAEVRGKEHSMTLEGAAPGPYPPPPPALGGQSAGKEKELGGGKDSAMLFLFCPSSLSIVEWHLLYSKQPYCMPARLSFQTGVARCHIRSTFLHCIYMQLFR